MTKVNTISGDRRRNGRCGMPHAECTLGEKIRGYRELCRLILQAREEVVLALMDREAEPGVVDEKCEVLGLLAQELASHAGEMASLFDVMEGVLCNA